MESNSVDTQIAELTKKVNKSLKELVRLHLGLKTRIDELEERIDQFNRRSGQKI